MSEPEPDPIAELLSQAIVLLDLDAARAEAWASGLLADWTDHDVLLAQLAANPGTVAGAIAVALTPMLPAAADLVGALRGQDVALPEYAPHVGTAVAVGAWAIQDRHGSGTSIVVEYEHDDGERHDMLVELDGDVAVDLLVGPPGVVEAALDEGERRFEVEELAPDVARDRIRAGMQRVLDGHVALLTDAYFLNHALVAARVGLPIQAPDPSEPVEREPERYVSPDPEGDALARSTLTSALARQMPTVPTPDQLAAAAESWRRAFDRDDEDAVAVALDAGVERDEPDDTVLLVRLAGAYVGPGPRDGLTPVAAQAVDALEWADWLGAVVGLVRGGVGADASPEQLVRNVNRSPEVTTSIPKRDVPAVASAFAHATVAWRVAGAVDDDARLTALGAWLLPCALAAAWGATPGTL